MTQINVGARGASQTLSRIALMGALALGVAASGCTRTGFGNANALQPSAAPAPLPAAPRPNVSGSRLPAAVPTSPTAIPAPGAPGTTAPTDASRPSLDSTPNTQIASATPTDAGQPVTEQALVGAWTVAVGGGACQIFMTLTTWSGGKRAAVKGCGGTDVADVQAWNLRGRQIVLVDRAGSTAATLYRSGDTRYDGSTSKGKAISFTR